jgi:hypothetical protein
MDQRAENKSVSVEESYKRLNTIQFFLVSVMLSLPLIGLVAAFVLSIRIVIFVIARSERVARDLAIAAAALTVGFFGMIVEMLWMFSGHVALAIVADVALNYCILTMVFDERLGHVFTKT